MYFLTIEGRNVKVGGCETSKVSLWQTVILRYDWIKTYVHCSRAPHDDDPAVHSPHPCYKRLRDLRLAI
jgi:hypothetical protein